jgi:predicted DNA-binding transcriptional regulator AlpA
MNSAELGRKGWLRAPAAAAYLRLSTSTLAKMRLRGDGPAYCKAGARVVVYDVADLDKWLTSQKRYSTSQDEERCSQDEER